MEITDTQVRYNHDLELKHKSWNTICAFCGARVKRERHDGKIYLMCQNPNCRNGILVEM